MSTKILSLVLCLLTISCGSTKNLKKSLEEQQNAPSYGYTPIDPLPYSLDEVNPALSKDESNATLIKELSDETIRLAIGNFKANANLSYGRSFVGLRGQSYIVVLDYIKYYTEPLRVNVYKYDSSSPNDYHVKLTDINDSDNDTAQIRIQKGFSFVSKNTIPLYVGVGLRMTADVRVLVDSVNLNLFGLGVAASSGKVSGTLIVQTLGISGETVTAFLPMPSELNQTTIENAIVALGSIRAKIYEPKTLLAPRVLGYYNNIGGNSMEVTDNIISQILIKQKTNRGKSSSKVSTDIIAK